MSPTEQEELILQSFRDREEEIEKDREKRRQNRLIRKLSKELGKPHLTLSLFSRQLITVQSVFSERENKNCGSFECYELT